MFYFPVEVGNRGFYITHHYIQVFIAAFPKGKRKPILDNASKTALRASYIIWLCRNTKAFRQIEFNTIDIMHWGNGEG